jgi:3-deoxy-D-manno-octulosonate 8-phosphate phosphatase (KDO 8-P phosphatase)
MSEPVVRARAWEKAARVTLLLLDVDGVLTDGKLVYDTAGRELKAFYVRDGHGIKMLQQSGIEVGIITGRRSEIVERRARELGIGLVCQGVADKRAAWQALLQEKGLTPEQTGYVGDDILDVPLLRVVGFAAAVGDAEAYVMEAADYVAARAGGNGAVREVTDFLLHAHGLWDSATAEFLGPRGGA